MRIPKFLLLITWFFLTATLSYAGTMSKESLKGYDPYLADQAGFDSLFINPAGMANQTEVFNITGEMGFSGKAKENLNNDNSPHLILEGETRWGTLIRGFGLGVYASLYSLHSLPAQGIEDLVPEKDIMSESKYGIIAGYGFELGRFKLGFSGEFALLVPDDPSIPFRIRQKEQRILYGHAWGLDAGLIWEPIESLRFGLVLNDFIGSITKESDMSKGTVQGILGGTIDDPSGGYSFALDMSMGVTWQPQGKVIQPKLSIDFYDVIGLIRSTNGNYSGLKGFYATDAPTFLSHIRAGANLRFWKFLDISLNYYMEYITLGVGLDIAFFEIFAEVRLKHNFEFIGVNGILRLEF